jgi:hypothetical protein
MTGSTPPWAAALVHDEDLIAEVFRVGRGYPAFIHCLLLPEPQPLPEVLLEYAMINDATDLACIFLQWQLGAVTCVEEVVAAALQFGGAVVLAKILQIGRARAPYNIIFPEALRGALSLRTLGIHPRLVLRLVNAAVTPVANPPWREGGVVLLWDAFLVARDWIFTEHLSLPFNPDTERSPTSAYRFWDWIGEELQSSAVPVVGSPIEAFLKLFPTGLTPTSPRAEIQPLLDLESHLNTLPLADRNALIATLPELPRRTLESGLPLAATFCVAYKEKTVRREERYAFSQTRRRLQADHPEWHWPDRYRVAMDAARVARRKAYADRRFVRALEGHWTAGLRSLPQEFEVLVDLQEAEVADRRQLLAEEATARLLFAPPPPPHR